MTTEILKREEIQQQINWDKPQWLVGEDNEIVLTNGSHTDVNFEATILPCEYYPIGEFSRSWSKSLFKLIQAKGLVIKIKN